MNAPSLLRVAAPLANRGKASPTLLTAMVVFLAALSLVTLATIENNFLPDEKTLNLAKSRFGMKAVERLIAWRQLVKSQANSSDVEKLEQVNRFFNRIPNVEDQTLWGQRDYWATPVELLVRNGGDCEDFALAKYFTLKAAGVASDKLRITYARAWLPRQGRMESHMVLSYYLTPDADPLILDNLTDDILPAPKRTDLVPTMAFNAEGLWSARQRGQHGRIGETGSIRHWNDLLARMSQTPNGDLQ